MTIVFMGTPEFAVPSLRILMEQGCTIAAVVTAPDKPRGRGQHVSCTPVKEFALAHGLPVMQPDTLRDPSFADTLRALAPDLFVVVAFRILPKEVFTIPSRGAFNLHASLLPKYRGAAPINWAIINGDTESGVTTFFLQEKVDTGNIILQKAIPVPGTMNAGELHDALMTLGASAVAETVRMIEEHRVVPLPQDDRLTSPAPKIFKDDCRIPWDRPALAIHNFIRGLSPHPAAWTTLHDKVVKVYGSRLAEAALQNGLPGTLLTAEGRLFVHTGADAVEILELQLEGKKRLSAAEFLRGHRLTSESAFK
jgi:methionyl-tRNA formyltransferase